MFSMAELLNETYSAQSSVATTESILIGDVTNHITKHNTSTEGIICWLNPGVSRHVQPELLNFKEALTYLMKNEEYESTGFDVFEIFHLPVDAQYNIIMSMFTASTRGSVPDAVGSRPLKKLSLRAYERLRDKHFPAGIDMNIDCNSFLEATKDITQTAMSVLVDVSNKKMGVSNSDGKYFFVLLTLC